MRRAIRVFVATMYSVVLPYLTACSPSPQQPVAHFELQAPKPFGYVIGDEIHHRIIVDTRKQLSLIKDSIPPVGAFNRWLQLKSATTAMQAQGDVDRVVIDLTYQVFYSPLEVKMLKIPSFTLRFKQYDQTVEQAVPEWHFTLSPLHELAVRKDEGQLYIRPDAESKLLSLSPYTERLGLSLMVLALMALYLAYRHGLLPWQRGQRVFKLANKELAKLTVTDIGTALNVFHHALNAFNQQPLFKPDLPEFYRRKPQFADIAAELDWFFNFSSLYFFANRHYVAEQDFTRLQQLSDRCRQLERSEL
jgi:mxaA protein